MLHKLDSAIKKHLIEIAETVKEQRVGILLLDILRDGQLSLEVHVVHFKYLAYLLGM
mgnify:CR=1 FL=1